MFSDGTLDACTLPMMLILKIQMKGTWSVESLLKHSYQDKLELTNNHTNLNLYIPP